MRQFIMPIVLAGMAFSPFVAHAQTITEAQVIRAAMNASPDFQAVYMTEEEEKADAVQVKTLENPTLDFSAVRTSKPDGHTNSFELEIEQPLKLSQLTGKRVNLADALVERAELRRQHGILQAYWNTKTLYAQAWQYQQQAKLYADFQKQAQEAATKINKSVKAGQTAVSEGSLFAGDVAKFGSDFEKLKALEEQTLMQLEKDTGLVLTGKELEKPRLDSFNGDVNALERYAKENASLVRLLEADLKTAERRRSTAIMDGTAPDIAPRFIYSRDSDNDEDAVGIGVVLTVPLWDSNQAERRKAEAARIYARRQLDTLQSLPLSQRLSQIVRSIQRLDNRITALGSEALPNYRTGFSQAQKSFNAGQTDAAALWQIRERLFATEQESLEATLDAIEARRILSLETGIIPQEVTQ